MVNLHLNLGFLSSKSHKVDVWISNGKAGLTEERKEVGKAGKWAEKKEKICRF